MMSLLSAAALLAVLLHRLGLLRPLREHRDALAFETLLLQIGEEIEWKDHMARLAQRRPVGYRHLSLQFRR